MQQVEGEHCEERAGGSPATMQAGKVGSPFLVWQHELGIDGRRTTGNPLQGRRDRIEALGPIIAAPAVQPHLAAVLDDLEPVAIELGSCSQASPAGGTLVGTGLQGGMPALSLASYAAFVST
jgi:hypothetical protein